MFGPKGTARRGLQKIAVILTDGKQTKTPDSIPLNQAVKPLQRDGVHLIAVGIGKSASRDELRLLTDNDQDVMLVSSFQDLQGKLETLKAKSCDGKNSVSSIKSISMFQFSNSA